MRHVFVETNWLVTLAAPARNPTPAAAELLDSAASGDIRLYIPGCCISEARKTIRLKFQPKETGRLREFVQWAVEKEHLDHAAAQSARSFLASFEQHVVAGLANLPDRIRDITEGPGVEVLPLDGQVLETSVALYFKEIELGEFDRAVLATVLTKGRSLLGSGETDISFCELDTDLWPWEKKTRRPRPELKKLYDDAGVRVYPDFVLNRNRPEGAI